MKKDTSNATYLWTTWWEHHAAWGDRHERVQCCGNTTVPWSARFAMLPEAARGKAREHQTPCCCVLISPCPLCNGAPRAPWGCTPHDTATKTPPKPQVEGRNAQIANPPTQTRQTWRPGSPASWRAETRRLFPPGRTHGWQSRRPSYTWSRRDPPRSCALRCRPCCRCTEKLKGVSLPRARQSGGHWTGGKHTGHEPPVEPESADKRRPPRAPPDTRPRCHSRDVAHFYAMHAGLTLGGITSGAASFNVCWWQVPIRI